MPSGLFLVIGTNKNSSRRVEMVTYLSSLPPGGGDLAAQLNQKKQFDADEIWVASFDEDEAYHLELSNGVWTIVEQWPAAPTAAGRITPTAFAPTTAGTTGMHLAAAAAPPIDYLVAGSNSKSDPAGRIISTPISTLPPDPADLANRFAPDKFAEIKVYDTKLLYYFVNRAGSWKTTYKSSDVP